MSGPLRGQDPNSLSQSAEAVRRWLADQFSAGRLTQDLGAKLLAFLAAGLLWFYASEDRRAIIEQSYDVPISVRDDTTPAEGETRAHSGLTPGTIKVTLSGRPGRLRELTGDRIEAMIDITDLPEGSFNEPITVLPPGDTQLVSSMPDRVQGLIDTVQTLELPVTVTVYAPGSAVMPNYQASPAQVTVSGPSRVVNTVEQIIHPPVTLAPGEEQTVSLLALDAEGKPVEGLNLQPATVQLSRVDSGELPAQRVGVELAPPPAGLRVVSAELSPAEVRLVGPTAALEELRRVVGVIDYRAGEYQTEVQLLTPAGVEALDRVTATVRIEAVPAATASEDDASLDTP